VCVRDECPHVSAAGGGGAFHARARARTAIRDTSGSKTAADRAATMMRKEARRPGPDQEQIYRALSIALSSLPPPSPRAINPRALTTSSCDRVAEIRINDSQTRRCAPRYSGGRAQS